MIFFKKIWNGELPLYVTFWIFGVIISLIIKSLLIYINQYYLLIYIKYGNYPFYFLMVLSLSYSVFIWISIWRCANKYRGSQIWAAGAKLMVIIGVLQTFISYDTGLLNIIFSKNNHPSSIQELKQDVLNLNKSLPVKVDKITEIYKVDLSNNSIIYFNRLVDLNPNQYQHFKTNNKSIKNNIKKNLAKTVCSERELTSYLEKNMHLIYKYEIDGSVIFTIHITKKDCEH